MFKYFDLFRKCLSVPRQKPDRPFFPTGGRTGGRRPGISDEAAGFQAHGRRALDEFYDRINAEYDCEGSFLILLIHSVYDIPGKASDKHGNVRRLRRGVRISPLQHLSGQTDKAGLCYNAEEGVIQNRIRDWLVEMPDVGFSSRLSRTGAPTSIISCSIPKTAGLPQAALAEHVLGCAFPLARRRTEGNLQCLRGRDSRRRLRL